MIIIYNKYIPSKEYAAINICGLIFARNEYDPLDDELIRHEAIHSHQMIELLVIFFYIWYIIEWLIRYIQYKDKKEAYYNISFEREAYANAPKSIYLKRRKLFAFISYLKTPRK